MVENLHDTAQRIELEIAAVEHDPEFFEENISPGSGLLYGVNGDGYGGRRQKINAPIASRLVDELGAQSAAHILRVRGPEVRWLISVPRFVNESEYEGLDADLHDGVPSSSATEWVRAYRQQSGISPPIRIEVELGTPRQIVAFVEPPGPCSQAVRSGIETTLGAEYFFIMDRTIEYEFVHQQMVCFHGALVFMMAESGVLLPLNHTLSSAAAKHFRNPEFRPVRVGISAHGHRPSRGTRLRWRIREKDIGREPRPAPARKVTFGQIHTVDTDETAEYGVARTARCRSQLAVILVASADGYSQFRGNQYRVVINGRTGPIVLRISLPVMMADITDVQAVAIGNEVVLTGSPGTELGAVENLAIMRETVDCSLLACTSPDIGRVAASCERA